MTKTMRTLAFVVLTAAGLLGLSTAASAQSAASPCPPGQPTGRPPGTPPGNPPVDTGRPQYPPGRCQLALSQSSAARGDTFRASGSGFVPGESVTLSIAGNPVKTVVADGNGTFDTDLTVPKNAVIGRSQVVAAGAGQELRADFEVLGSSASRSSASARANDVALPRTGVELAGVASFGALLVVIGGMAIAATRRRRTATA